MKRGRPRHDDILTPREWEVLALLAKRRSNPEIAVALGISLSGVKYHVSEILSKLGVESREEAGRLYRTHQPKQPAAWLAPLTLLRRLVPGPALFGGSAAVIVCALLALVVLNGEPAENGARDSDLYNEAIGLDLPPEEQPGVAETPAPSLANTLLLTKETPANTGSGAATIAAMRRVSNVTELQAALHEGIRVIVIDRSAVDELRGTDVLREQLIEKRILVGVNISHAELTALSSFNAVVSSGCPDGCEPPGIRAPAMPDRGFYSFVFINREIPDNPDLFMGTAQEYFFEERFEAQVIGFDTGTYKEAPSTLLKVVDFPADRIYVNRGMFCTFNDTKVAAVARRNLLPEYGDELVFGIWVNFCLHNADGTVTLGVNLLQPRELLQPSAPCVSTPTAIPPPHCTPEPNLAPSTQMPPLRLTVPLSEISP